VRRTLRLKALIHKSKLSVLQQKHVLCSVCKVVYEPETEVSMASCMQFWFAELLHAMGWLPADQWGLVVSRTHHDLGTRLHEALKEHPNMITCRDVDPQTIIQVIFLDGKYVMWSGYDGFLELATGDHIDNLPSPPIESVAYNMWELVRRELNRCRPIEHDLGL